MATILFVDSDPLQAFVRMALVEKKFPGIKRVADATEVFCLIEQPDFARQLILVIADLRQPGLGAGDFVNELFARLPGLPILLLGGAPESPALNAGQAIHILSPDASSEEIVSAAGQLLTGQNSMSTR